MHSLEQDHDHDRGLAHDLDTLMRRNAERRRVLRWLAAGSVAPLVTFGCGGGGDDTTSSGSSSTTSGSTTGTTTTTTTTTTGSGSTSSCAVIPEETAGPYPGDGSNSTSSGVVNVLTLSGIVRSDIRTSVGGLSGTASGMPLTVKLELVNTNGSCADLAGYAIYLWHCTADGNYSLYSSSVLNQNYLRGVQETDSSGTATFVTVFPGCYSGRMPHIHFEVYRSLATATASTSKLKTSQMAFPVATCQQVYATSGYSASVSNLASISFATDNVFSDGTSLQMASVTGDTSNGYVATLQLGIAA
jgi:protocatechuate 3,4-dioxygenase beta subunit